MAVLNEEHVRGFLCEADDLVVPLTERIKSHRLELSRTF